MSSDQHRPRDLSKDPAEAASQPGPLSDAGGQGASPDDESTWSAGQGDPFQSDGFLDETPTGPAKRGSRGCDVAREQPAQDGKATYVPTDSREIADVWGSDFDDVTPRMTLKPESQTARPRPKLPPRSSPNALPDVKLEGYDLLEVLGEGGVGVVYQAVQKSIDRRIAVKMIKDDVGRDAKERAKFISEAMVTGDLDHPNIVPIHDLGQTVDGRPFYAMKMVKGTPWSEQVRANTVPENLRILLDVCDAVSFAHSKGVVHRDLKPENVMLGEFGEVQLMDWGLGASVTDAGKGLRLNASRAAGGTPAYMAPEMVIGEDPPVGIHSDVYLLGAILWEIITGRPPHPGVRVMDTLESALHNVIEPTDQGGVLVDIALRAMRTEPADRFPSVREFRQAILDYQANAESINLCLRATEDLTRARVCQDYEAFTQALFGFREALKLWPGNEQAQQGLVDAQLDYARCACDKGDLDLAATTLDPDCPAHRALADEVAAARRQRAGARRRLRLFRAAAISLAATVTVVMAVAYIWISAAERRAVRAMEAAIDAKHEAVEAKEVAVVAREAETEQRRLAEAATVKAQHEEARAVKALTDLETAVQAVVAAQSHEERALAQARAAELVAAETRDELAKTGMLLDNAWWVFDAEAAAEKQRQAAAEIGMPVELDIRLADGVPLELVLVPAGEFVMGSPPQEEKRAADEYLHRVSHRRPLYIGRYEFTEAQWRAVTGLPPPGTGREVADAALPVAGLSLGVIEDQLLPAMRRYAPEGYEFRLPTEAEWEYACRAGSAAAYQGGDGQAALDTAGWFLFNSERRVQPVGGKAPNAFGLYDVHGNVAELCADQYEAGFYLESPTVDPLAAPAGERPIVRGGSVMNTPEHCRAAYRSYAYRKNQYEFVGLRLALVPCSDH